MYSKEKIFDVINDIIEESKKIAPYVVIAQPRRVEDETPAQSFQSPGGMGAEHVDLHGFSHGYCNVYGEVVDVARNYLIEQVLESDAKYMFFIGEDTVVPYQAFKQLHKTAEQNPNSIVVGVYYIKIGDPMIMVKEKNWIIVPNCDPGQLFPVHMCGMDCMLIPVDVLRRMKEEEPQLPFCCIYNKSADNKNADNPDKDKSPEIQFIGEDNFFIHRVHSMGIPILCNTDVQCLHMDLATGKYTAHTDVDLNDYKTLTKPTVPLTEDDRNFIDKRWHDRLPKGSNNQNQNNKK